MSAMTRAPFRQNRAEEVFQNPIAERLSEMRIENVFARGGSKRFRQRRKGRQENGAGERNRTNASRGLMAIHDRHVDIENNQLWLETGNQFDCGDSAINRACIDAHHLQERYKAIRNLLVIIDDQNSTGVVAFLFVIESLFLIHSLERAFRYLCRYSRSIGKTTFVFLWSAPYEGQA